MSEDGHRGGSPEQRRLSLGGEYSRIYRRQNRRIQPAAGPAALEENQSSAAQPSALQEFVTPAITVTHPAEELGSEEVSEIILPEGHVSGEEEEQPDRDEALCSPPHSSLPTAQPGEWPGRLSRPTVLVDQPILEEEDEEEAEKHEEDRDEENVTKEKKDGSGASQRSRWGHIRSRALSYPVDSPGSGLLQSMLQVARPQPATGEKRDEGEDEAVARGDVSETKSKDSSEHEAPAPVGKFVQMALMAKKWKNRSKEETTSSRTSRENLCDRQKRRPMVEIPRALKLEVLEEAHQIVHKTLQRYRSELGLHHKLTLQAEQHCENLAQQLGHTQH